MWMTIPSHGISNSKVNQPRGTKIEQENGSNLPKKHPQLGNPSIVPKFLEWSSYAVASPWFSKFVVVPSGTPLDLQVYCHQDPKYVLSWEHTS